jgi:acetyl-CoA acetyltransferase
MPEAVIVDAVRTPIGRAVKGSLKDVRTDDLAAVPLKALVERNPGVDFGETVDVMMVGLTAENVAERCKVSRAAQDEWAKLSQDRAVAARDGGHFDAEIVPVGEVTRDDGSGSTRRSSTRSAGRSRSGTRSG